MSVAIFHPKKNSPGKRDVTGAFRPGAMKFQAARGGLIHEVDNGRPFRERADEVLECLELQHDAGVVAFFCHGWRTGIQLGFRSPKHPRYSQQDRIRWVKLVDLLSRDQEVEVLLYACSTGQDPDPEDDPAEWAFTGPGSGPWWSEDDPDAYGDDSFGDLLRDALCYYMAENCRVVSHFTAGHAWHNPDLVFFDGLGMPYGARGGITFWRTQQQRRVLRRLLKTTDLAWHLGEMDYAEIGRRIEEG